MGLGGVLPDTPAINVAVTVVATGFICLGSGWLEDAAEELSAYYGLPAVVQGSVVVAVGSSFPECASVVFTALAGVFDMGVGAIVGSAIFNILVIPALSGLLADQKLESSRTIVYKETQFYMIAVSALVVTFALAVINEPIAGNSVILGRLTRPLAAVPLLVYGRYLFIQWQDVSDHQAADAGGDVAVARDWATLVAGLLVILVVVEQLVGAVESLSATVGMAAFMAGITIVAAATSLPHPIVSVWSARGGLSATSLGNVLGRTPSTSSW